MPRRRFAARAQLGVASSCALAVLAARGSGGKEKTRAGMAWREGPDGTGLAPKTRW
ncbi:MAG TPA: hypothetical protein VF728_05515 [Nocardioides sp.]